MENYCRWKKGIDKNVKRAGSGIDTVQVEGLGGEVKGDYMRN